MSQTNIPLGTEKIWVASWYGQPRMYYSEARAKQYRDKCLKNMIRQAELTPDNKYLADRIENYDSAIYEIKLEWKVVE